MVAPNPSDAGRCVLLAQTYRQDQSVYIYICLNICID